MSASLQTDPSLAEGRALEKWVDSGGVATSDDPESMHEEGEDMMCIANVDILASWHLYKLPESQVSGSSPRLTGSIVVPKAN